jgi:hypothetical protein
MDKLKETSHGRTTHRLKDNIKMGHKKQDGRAWNSLIWLKRGTGGSEFLEQLSKS